MTATDLSRIDEIVDSSAAVAAAYVTGIRAVWGIGSDKVTVPVGGTWDGSVFKQPGGVWAGNKVRPFVGDVVEDMTHVSDMPDAPKIIWHSAGATELNWRVPMRLYVGRAADEQARRLCAPFYARYILAFSKHMTLFGTCNACEIGSFDLFHDRDGTGFVGISMVLNVREYLDTENDTDEASVP